MDDPEMEPLKTARPLPCPGLDSMVGIFNDRCPLGFYSSRPLQS
jgi:hypothetical protein